MGQAERSAVLQLAVLMEGSRRPRPSRAPSQGHRLIPGAEHCPPSGPSSLPRIAPAHSRAPSQCPDLLVVCSLAVKEHRDAESGRLRCPRQQGDLGAPCGGDEKLTL